MPLKYWHFILILPLTDSIQILIDYEYPVRVSAVVEWDINLTVIGDLIDASVHVLGKLEQPFLTGDNCQLVAGAQLFDTVVVNSNFWRVETLDTPAVSQAELEAQKACYTVADFFRTHVPGFGKAHIGQMASDLGIRISRGIEGEATLTADAAGSDRPVESDSVIGCQPSRASFKDTGEL